MSRVNTGTKLALLTDMSVLVMEMRERRCWVVRVWDSDQWPSEVKYSVLEGAWLEGGAGAAGRGPQVGSSSDMAPVLDTSPKQRESLGLRRPSLLSATRSRSLSRPQAWSIDSRS